MSPTVVFLWISAAREVVSGAPRPEAAFALAAPRAASREDDESSFVLSDGKPATGAVALLRDYGVARGINFVPLAEHVELGATTLARPLGSLSTDPRVADEVEAELEQAATALSALEEASALERLARVEKTLLAHPDLPQAAWLLAECFSLRARAAAATDAAAAGEHELRRAALEGQRATPFGESSTPTLSPADLRLSVRGLAASDELEVDGSLRDPSQVALLPGLHQVRVLRGGRVVFAAFRQVPAGATELALDVPKLVPCSAEDLADVDGEALAKGKRPPAGIACSRFALVRPANRSIEIAMCSPQGCGPFVSWSEQPGHHFRPIAIERRLPSWAGFAIVGATAAIATSLVLWQAGAFDQGRPSAARWEYGGLSPQGIRF